MHTAYYLLTQNDAIQNYCIFRSRLQKPFSLINSTPTPPVMGLTQNGWKRQNLKSDTAFGLHVKRKNIAELQI